MSDQRRRLLDRRSNETFAFLWLAIRFTAPAITPNQGMVGGPVIPINFKSRAVGAAANPVSDVLKCRCVDQERTSDAGDRQQYPDDSHLPIFQS